MSTATVLPPRTSAPAGFILWHREHRKHARWRKVLVTRDHAEATARISSAGDWWLAVIADERLLSPTDAGQHGLFDTD